MYPLFLSACIKGPGSMLSIALGKTSALPYVCVTLTAHFNDAPHSLQGPWKAHYTAAAAALLLLLGCMMLFLVRALVPVLTPLAVAGNNYFCRTLNALSGIMWHPRVPLNLGVALLSGESAVVTGLAMLTGAQNVFNIQPSARVPSPIMGHLLRALQLC